MSETQLNERAWSFVESQLACNEWLKDGCSIAGGGGRIIDCEITGDGSAAGQADGPTMASNAKKRRPSAWSRWYAA